MPTTQKNPAPYHVITKCLLGSTFVYIAHEDYPGATRRFEGTGSTFQEVEDQAQVEATRLNGKVAEWIQRGARS